VERGDGEGGGVGRNGGGEWGVGGVGAGMAVRRGGTRTDIERGKRR